MTTKKKGQEAWAVITPRGKIITRSVRDTKYESERFLGYLGFTRNTIERIELRRKTKGVCGFGDTPDKACEAFDKNWYNQKLKQ